MKNHLEQNNSYQNKKSVRPSRVNPFVSEMVTTIKQGHKTTGFATTKRDVLDPKTGEITGETAVTGFKKTVDKDEFVKIFSNSVYEIFDCSKRAKDVFSILLKHYMKGEYNSDKVYFNYFIAKEDYGYDRSSKTFIPAMNELIYKRFIAEVEGQSGMYWINPNMFFKGDRMVLMQDIAVRGTQSAINQEKEIRDFTQLQLFEE